MKKKTSYIRKHVNSESSNYTSLNLNRDTKILLRNLKLSLIISIILILAFYTLIDIYVFHGGDLNKSILKLTFHEFWVYLIILIFFIIIFIYSKFITKNQINFETSIKDSEERYLRLIKGAKDLFSSIQDGIAVLDKELNIFHINPSLRRLYYYKEPIIGKKCYEVYENRTKPCETCPNLSLIENKLIKSKIHSKLDEKGNIIGSLEIFSFPLLDQSASKMIGIINYCKDITEKIKAEQLIIQENKKLLEIDQFRKNLIIRVSHEFKTPLNSIQSATQLLLQNYIIDNHMKEFLEIIYKGGTRLTELVERILKASEIESGKLVLMKEKTDISELFQNCIDEVSLLVLKRSLYLKSNLPKSIFLNIDPSRIEQVIMNLLSNAIKNTPPHGEIYIDINNNTSHIDFRIKDSGIGLTKEEQERLFIPFSKIERYGQNMNVDIEGSGLGLYLSNEIVKLHGGKILIESSGRNKGCTFILRLNKE
ncbi:MAG: ATP-binding protein [Promethearchaeota archaeon]